VRRCARPARALTTTAVTQRISRIARVSEFVLVKAKSGGVTTMSKAAIAATANASAQPTPHQIATGRIASSYRG
jgi:hypothetical protein